MRNIPLDCFRGIFALIVAFGHFYAWSGYGSVYPVSFVCAVDFFFVLSGYVLVNSIVKEDCFNLEKQYITFFLKRIFRIFPLYYFTTILGFLITSWVNGTDLQLNYMRLFQVVFLGQMTGFSDGGNFLNNSPAGIAWSISAEIWVGFLFFTIVFLLKNKLHLMFIVSLFLAWICLVTMNRFAPNGMEETYRQLSPFLTFGSIRCLLGFSAGFMTWYVAHKITIDLGKGASVFQILIVSIIFYLYYYHYDDRGLGILSPVFSSMLIYFFTFNGAVYKCLNNKIGEWFGKLSFSIYLVHPIIIAIAIKLEAFPSFYMNLLYVFVLAIMSLITYSCIESRFAKLYMRINL